jgi:hypothetical protein
MHSRAHQLAQLNSIKPEGRVSQIALKRSRGQAGTVTREILGFSANTVGSPSIRRPLLELPSGRALHANQKPVTYRNRESLQSLRGTIGKA